MCVLNPLPEDIVVRFNCIDKILSSPWSMAYGGLATVVVILATSALVYFLCGLIGRHTPGLSRGRHCIEC